MNNMWKRTLSFVLTLAMVIGMVPFGALRVSAAEVGDTVVTKTSAAPAAEEKAVWVLDEGTVLEPNPRTVCEKGEHTHSDGCYTKTCDHNDGHLSTCYSSSTSYALCNCEANGLTHSGAVTLTDVVTISGTNVSWKTDHPAYSVVYGVYKQAYDEAYASAKWMKDMAGKAAGVAALLDKTFCYTVTGSATPDLCTHTCTEVGGSCYTKLCLYSYEHTHDTSETGCYEYRWTLKADINNNETADDAETYTVRFVDRGIPVSEQTLNLGDAVTTPADPTREHYTFTGWTPAVVETVVCPARGTVIEYNAGWQANNDANGNDTADEEETYTVIYDDGKGNASTFADLALNAATPTVEDPSAEGWEFLYWSPAVAETVLCPASGNTITYTAVWKELGKIAVTFDDRGTKSSADYYEGQTVEKPADPTWDEDHDFLGWYLGDIAYDFAAALSAETTDFTLTAAWRNDFNRNDVEDSTEAHYTVKYVVDGAEEVYENILTGLATPAYSKGTPAKEGHTFLGWDKEVAGTVTADAVYTARWITDINQNQVDDAEETVTLVVTGSGTVTLNGETVTSLVYDSTKNEQVTIAAAPVVTDGVSGSVVESVSVGSATAELTYADDFSVTHTFAPDGTQTVTVVFAAAGFEKKEERILNYYDGMEGLTDKAVYDAAVSAPAYDDGQEVTVTYKAREAMTLTVNIDQLSISDTYKKILKLIYPSGTMTFDAEELWMGVNEKVKESVSLETAVNAYINDETLGKIYSVFENNGGLFGGGLNAARAELEKTFTAILDAAKYHGAHNFGFNNTDAETVEELLRITWGDETMYLAEEMTITLKDLRASSAIAGTNAKVIYKDYTDEDLIAAIGACVTDAEGVKIEGAEVYSLDITDPYTFEGKAAGETPYEITLKFAGNANYKPSEAVFTVTVEKAPASIDVPNVNITYGTAYSLDPAVTLGNAYGEKSELTGSMIRFIAGLDVADVDVNADGVTGLTGTIQLLLPEDLQKLLDSVSGGSSEGLTMTLSQLQEYLELVNDDSVAVLKNALEVISGVTEAGDLKITVGGTLPTDTGAYLHGAVTTNSNYETAFDVGYLIIKPKAQQLYLQFNYEDENHVFTQELMANLDLGASAFDDKAFTTLNAEVTGYVHSLFFGIDPHGELIATMDGAELTNGAFTQIAFLGEFGNETYYAVPIARAMLIVPNLADVELADADGNVLDHYEYTFDNTEKPLYALVDGVLTELEVRYYGVQSNARIHKAEDGAPVHAGVYTASVIYVSYNADGEMDKVGADTALITILPTESSISVTGGTVAHDGKTHGVTVEAASAVSGLTPDVTLLSGSIDVNADLDGLGLKDVTGSVNVDFPAWLDEILSRHFAGAYESGVTAKDFVYKFSQYQDKLLELGLPEDLLSSLNSLLEELPDNVTLTFGDNKGYANTGAYFYLGIVTDSDHLPAVDTGLVLIQKEELGFALKDTTVSYDGAEHFVDTVNPNGSDYAYVMIDRENNVGNIVLEDDLNSLKALLEEALGRELPQRLNVTELMAAVNGALSELESLEELPAHAREILAKLQEVLAKLPQTGMIYLNGSDPVNVGTYEFHAITYSLDYTTVLSSATLKIVPAEVTVTMDSHTVTVGDEMPELTWTVTEGTVAEGDSLKLTVSCETADTLTAGEYTITAEDADDNYAITVIDGTLTVEEQTEPEKPDDHEGEYPLVLDPESDTTGTIVPGATVEVDGVPYVLDENCTVWLPNTDARLLTTYSYKNGDTAYETYPTHMYVWLLTITDTDGDAEYDSYTAERVEPLDDIMKYEGTSIRVNFTSNGIRFFTSMPSAEREKLMKGTLLTGALEGYTLVEAGTLYRKWTEEGCYLTHENGQASFVYGGTAGDSFRVFSTVGDRNWYTGMLTGLDGDAATLGMDILSRPFLTLEKDGQTLTLYGGTVQRSVYYVATQNRDYWAPGTAYDNFVENIISTVEASNG